MTTAGAFTEYALPTNNAQPEGITVGPDGALWFVETGGKAIGRITTAGVITTYPLPQGSPNPTVITAGPDGALWFGSNGGGSNSIGRITTAGVLSFFAIPNGSNNITGIVAGPDGALWFNENGTSVGRLTTTGLVTTYLLPAGPNNAQGITAGPDGNLYLVVKSNDTYSVESITTLGVVTQFAIPTANATPWGITVGPDGSLWYTENKANRVGNLDVLPGQVVTPIVASGQAIAATENTPFLGVVATFTDPSAGGLLAQNFLGHDRLGRRLQLHRDHRLRRLPAASFTISGAHTYANGPACTPSP